jgi:hypothetical protein
MEIAGVFENAPGSQAIPGVFGAMAGSIRWRRVKFLGHSPLNR